MTQKEEIYARQFYQELQKEYCGRQNPISRFLGMKSNEQHSDIVLTLKEAGTQSFCNIRSGARQCSIHCFAIDRNDLQFKGAEFYTIFLENGNTIANGRTFDKLRTKDAIKRWMQNKTLDELYAEFDFIDEQKRQLNKLRAEINKVSPQLASISQNEVAEERFSSYSLWFGNDNRKCRIYYYGYEPYPRYVFYWDDSIIFEISGSGIKKTGSLITKWVIDKAMPSSLKDEFPEIDFGKLAEYYEQGKGVEGEYMLSWDNIEAFYRETDLDQKSAILLLIADMREKGFDRTLRAGQSLFTFIVSRSRRHGLRPDQASVSFSFKFIKTAMEVQTPKGEKIGFERIEYNDRIERILRAIEDENID
jgi:hypothetical protein